MLLQSINKNQVDILREMRLGNTYAAQTLTATKELLKIQKEAVENKWVSFFFFCFSRV